MTASSAGSAPCHWSVIDHATIIFISFLEKSSSAIAVQLLTYDNRLTINTIISLMSISTYVECI